MIPPFDGTMKLQELIGTRGALAAIPLMGGGLFFQRRGTDKQKMNLKLFVDNLPKSITQQELTDLFSQAGDVTMMDLITDRKSGEVKGFAFVAMNTRSEAEKAIHMFNTFSIDRQEIKVSMAKPSFRL